VGGLNTAVGLLIIFGTKFFLEFGDVAANALGYSVGLAVSFFFNSRWTFEVCSPISRFAMTFIVAFALSYFFNLVVVLILISWFSVDSYFAQTVGVVTYTVSFYLLIKTMVF